jgi:hypothetical protein
MSTISRRYPIAAAFAIGLTITGLAAACTSTSVVNDVSAAEIALTAAFRVVVIYESLPRCGGTATICSNQATVDNIKALSTKAYTAVKAAEQDETLVSAAWVAISSLTSATPIVK